MSIYGFGIHGGFQAGNGTKNVWRNVSGNHVQGNSRAAGQENGAARRAGNSFADLAGSALDVRTYTVYMKTDDMLYSGGNGTGLSFYIKYADSSTEDDPTVVAKGVDEHGNDFEQTIHINKINPECATLVEMRALEAYLGVDKNGGLSSLPPETGKMGLHDRADFMELFQKQIHDMRVLKQGNAAAYYQYSMQEYADFMNQKSDSDSSFTFAGAQALEEVKRAWMEAAAKTGVLSQRRIK